MTVIFSDLYFHFINTIMKYAQFQITTFIILLSSYIDMLAHCGLIQISEGGRWQSKYDAQIARDIIKESNWQRLYDDEQCYSCDQTIPNKGIYGFQIKLSSKTEVCRVQFMSHGGCSGHRTAEVITVEHSNDGGTYFKNDPIGQSIFVTCNWA